MVRRLRWFVLIVLVIGCASIGAAGDMAEASVLLVSGGHTLQDMDELPEDRFESTYVDALEAIDNVAVDVVESPPDGHGPSAETMAEYDAVIWYTLNDFEDHENCPADEGTGDEGPCTTFFGDHPNHPGNAGGDVENITEYLWDHNGRMFVTGQRVHFDNWYTPLEEDVFGIYRDDDQWLEECESGFFGPNCWSIEKHEMHSVLEGVRGEPVSQTQLFRPEFDTAIQPPEERGVFISQDDGGDSMANFHWRHEGDNWYEMNVDGNWFNVYSMVRNNPDNYKSLYAGFGVEAIKSADDRTRLMNNTLNYLLGPRPANTTVEDTDDDTDYPKYTDDAFDVSSVCHNRQQEKNTEVASAQFFVDEDGGIPDNPRDPGSGHDLYADDGAFDSSTEPVYYDEYPAADNIDTENEDRGVNVTIAAHCQDESYWGGFQKDWIVVDTEPPFTPQYVQILEKYEDEEIIEMNVSYADGADIIAEEGRSDLVRFSCDAGDNGAEDANWSEWREYDYLADEQTYEVNVTSDGMGCGMDDGNRSVYAQVRDFAGNVQDEIVSDWVVLDREPPEFQEVDPEDGSHVQSDVEVQVNATDDWAIDETGVAFNGTHNETFEVNGSVDPAWGVGEQSLKAWIFDRAGNVVSDLFTFTVDDTPPVVDDIDPVNGSEVTAEDSIAVNVSDSHAVSHLVVDDGIEEHMFQGDGPELEAVIDPDWTEEGLHNLSLQMNDTAGNTRGEMYQYQLDETPPTVDVEPVNDSVIQNGTEITASVDSTAEIDTLLYSNGTVNRTFVSGEPFDPAWDEGEQSLTLYMNDTLGNRNVTAYRYVVDGTPPVSSVEGIPDDWEDENVSVDITATDNVNVSHIMYCTYDAEGSACEPDRLSAGNVSLDVGCPAGDTCEQYVRFHANDTAGNVEDLDTSDPIRIDKEPPTVDIENPDEGEETGGTVDLWTEITDAGVGVDADETKYSVVNASNASDIRDSGSLDEDWNAEWDSSSVEDNGSFVFNVTATDELGNVREVNVTFFIDNAAPTTSVRAPDETYHNDTITLDIRAQAPGAEPLRNHSYAIRNASGDVVADDSTEPDADEHVFDGTVPVDSWEDGNYTVNTTAWDDVPQRSESSTWFVLDREPPSIDITQPENESWQNGTVDIGFTAADDWGMVEDACEWRYRDGEGDWSGTDQIQCGVETFTFDTALCDDTADGDCRVQVRATDRAGNMNASTIHLNVDNTPPETQFESPDAGAWQNQTFTVNRTDTNNVAPDRLQCTWNVTAGEYHDADCSGTFDVDLDDCTDDEGEDVCDVTLHAENAVNLTDTVTRSFSVDTTPPAVIDVSPAEGTVINGSRDISVTHTGALSGIDTVEWDSGVQTDQLENGSAFDPGWDETGVENLTVFINDTAGNVFEEAYTYHVDVTPPSISRPAFNVTTDPAFNDTRIPYDAPITVMVNASDEHEVAALNATVELPGGDAENHSLSLQAVEGGDATGDMTVTGTDMTGLYNVTRLYAVDGVGNMNATTAGASFRVVNHSLTATLGGDGTVNAGNVTALNTTIDFNRTRDGAATLFLPEREGIPYYTNRSSFDCTAMIGGCTVEAVEDTALTVNASSATRASVTADVLAGTPGEDTETGWVAQDAGQNRTGSTMITAPHLNLTRMYCDGDQDCDADQYQNVTITATLVNEKTENSTGVAVAPRVAFGQETLGIDNQTMLAAMSSEAAKNASVTANMTVAGTASLDVTAVETVTGAYMADMQEDIDVTDTLPPELSSPGVERQFLNLDETNTLSVQVADNVAADAVTAAVEDPEGDAENRSMELVEGSPSLGIWEYVFDDTGEEGIYNMTDVYAVDEAGNREVIRPGEPFEVTDLQVAQTVNTTAVGPDEPVRVDASVTGNATGVEEIDATAHLPRGGTEVVSLKQNGSADGSEEYWFTGTFPEHVQSGEHTVNVSVLAGNAVYDDSQTFNVSFGHPGVELWAGNGTYLELSQEASPHTVPWAVQPVEGDIEDVNTSIEIADPAILDVAQGQEMYEEAGDVFMEDGAGTVGYELEAESAGVTDITVDANTSRGATDDRTVTVNVTGEESDAPNITDHGTDRDTVNVGQNVTIGATVDEPSLLHNVTVQVHHPEEKSGAATAFREMEQTGTGEFAYLFSGTNESGHYTYNVTAEDVDGNTHSIRSESFAVDDTYNVTVSTDHDIYRKGERPEMEVTVEDVQGNPVDTFNTTMELDKVEETEELLTDAEEDTAAYRIRESDMPHEDDDQDDVPATYVVHANVSDGGNTGSTNYTFDVTRLLGVEFTELPEGNQVSPGATFDVEIRITGARGEPVSAVTVVHCFLCEEEGSQFMTPVGDGRYQETFTAPEGEDAIDIQAFTFDGLGNSESQEGPTGPFVSLDVGEDDDPVDDTSDDPAQPAPVPDGFDITVISPGLNLPPDQEQANFAVETDEPVVCRYADSDVGFEEAQLFGTEEAATHHTTTLSVEQGTTYRYHVYCENDEGTVETTEYGFTVAAEEIESYSLDMPDDAVSVEQGDQGATPVAMFNNGTSPVTVDVDASADCCATWFADLEGDRTGSLTMAPETGQVLDLHVEVPLSADTGRYTVVAQFTRDGRTQERTAMVDVDRSSALARMEEIHNRAGELEERIQQYQEAGVDTSAMEEEYDQLVETVDRVEAAVQVDDRESVDDLVAQAEEREAAVSNALQVRSPEFLFRSYWMELAGGVLVLYLVFAVISMVVMPYRRLREEYREVQEDLQEAEAARKKAEKQYFKREINQEVFQDIQTDRQNQILHLRGRRDELEEQLEGFVREHLTPRRIVMAPAIAFRQSQRTEEEEDETVQELAAKVEELESELAELQDYRERIDAVWESGRMTDEEYEELMQTYESKRSRLIRKIERVSNELEDTKESTPTGSSGTRDRPDKNRSE